MFSRSTPLWYYKGDLSSHMPKVILCPIEKVNTRVVQLLIAGLLMCFSLTPLVHSPLFIELFHLIWYLGFLEDRIHIQRKLVPVILEQSVGLTSGGKSYHAVHSTGTLTIFLKPEIPVPINCSLSQFINRTVFIISVHEIFGRNVTSQILFPCHRSRELSKLALYISVPC